ncbi:MAG: hypothetical protein GX190_00215 [Mollicutes bacterium]|nr:hypothetical protein [Mollicutes bacterium]
MKNTINYFYNLYPENIHQNEKQYKFKINNNKYVFLPCYRPENEIKELQILSATLFSQGIYFHQIISNKDSSVVTFVNNIPYVLLQIYIDDNRQVTFEDLIWFSKIKIPLTNELLKKDKWFLLWSEKIDYFEYQVNQFGKSFPLIRESFSYFVGLAEIGISFLKNNNTSNEKTLSLSHGRIKSENTLFDLYNPLNFIIDSKIRNFCEYFKDYFFKGNNIAEDFFYYISTLGLNYTDYILLYARMLFPTFYFDIYELIIHGYIPEKELLKIIQKVDEYEVFLKRLHNYLKQFVAIPDIEWLSKINT